MVVSSPTVAHLTSAHAVDDVRIFVKECRSLADGGFDVVLVGPNAKSFENAGVRILGVPVARGRFSRMTKTVWHVLTTAIKSRAAVCHIHDPELLPVAFLLKILGRKVVYDVHEDYPGKMLTKHWLTPIVRRPLAAIIEGVEALAGKMFDAIVTVTPTIEARFPTEKTVRLANFPILEEFAGAGDIPYLERLEQVSYVGGLQEARGLFDMRDAAALLDGVGAERCLHLVGKYISQAAEDACRTHLAWKRIHSHGWVGRKEVADVLGNSRAGLAMLHPVSGYDVAYPIKMFEYMSAKLPVIASDFPVFREILGDGQCGILVPPRDPEALAEAIRWIFANPEEAKAMGEHGRNRVISLYNWHAESEKLIDLYRNLLMKTG